MIQYITLISAAELQQRVRDTVPDSRVVPAGLRQIPDLCVEESRRVGHLRAVHPGNQQLDG